MVATTTAAEFLEQEFFVTEPQHVLETVVATADHLPARKLATMDATQVEACWDLDCFATELPAMAIAVVTVVPMHAKANRVAA